MSKSEKGVEEDDFALEDEIKEVEAETSSHKSSVIGDAKRRASMMSKKKREIDPIIAVSAVVLILACSIVLVNATYDMHFNKDPGAAVEYGNTVTVDYIGCYGDFYSDENGGTVFDTTLKSIDTDSKTVKSWEYKSKSFSPIEVTVGSGSFLKMFEDSLIGHHVGDKIKVCIPAKDGYGEVPSTQKMEYTGNGNVEITSVMTDTDFEDLFGKSCPSEGMLCLEPCYPDENEEEDKNEPSTPYGFGANVVKNSNNTVTVQYTCEVGTTYKMNDKMSVKVTEIKDGKIYYDYELVDPSFNNGMIRICQNNVSMYLCIHDDDVYVKTCEERVGEDLYFTITITGFVKETS